MSSQKNVLLPTMMLMALTVGCTLDFDEFAESNDSGSPEALGGQGGALSTVDAMAGGTQLESDAPAPGGTGGVEALDADGDGTPDGADNCPEIANEEQIDTDEDGIGDGCDDDRDGDAIENSDDNCPDIDNGDQRDLDGDGRGDACDDDVDGDGWPAELESRLGSNPRWPDSDFDGFNDPDDNCPVVANPSQRDTDGDESGDACDQDDDADGIWDIFDSCPMVPNPEQMSPVDGVPDPACPDDLDADGIIDENDDCPSIYATENGIRPCTPNFEANTYVESITSLTVSSQNAALIAATPGGLVDVRGPFNVRRQEIGFSDLGFVRVLEDSAFRLWLLGQDRVTAIRPNGLVYNYHSTDQGGGLPRSPQDIVEWRSAIWISSDSGLSRLDRNGWTFVDQDLIGIENISALWVDSLDRLWIVGSSKVGHVQTDDFETVTILPDLEGLNSDGGFTDVVAGPDGKILLLGTERSVLVNTADEYEFWPPTNMGAIRAVAHLGDEFFLATDRGLIRRDGDRRFMPPSRALDGSSITSMAQTDDGQKLWVGSTSGLFRTTGYFSTYTESLSSSCAYDALRAGGNIWVAADVGVLRGNIANEFTQIESDILPMLGNGVGPPARVLARIEGAGGADGDAITQVWVGTTAGVSIYNSDGTHIRSLTLAEIFFAGQVEPPANEDDESFAVSALVQSQQFVWIGSDGAGLARVALEDLSVEVFNEASNPTTVASNTITGLAVGDGQVWASTPFGISRHDGTSFLPFIGPENGLPSAQVNDIAYGGGTFFIATNSGLAHCNVNQGCRGENNLGIGLGETGLPVALGTDYIRSIAYVRGNVWLSMAVSSNCPRGCLLRRNADPSDLSDTEIFKPEEAGVPILTGDAVNLSGTDLELILTSCNESSDPGGVSFLPGGDPRDFDSEGYGLPGKGENAQLTEGLSNRPLWIGTGGSGEARGVFLDTEVPRTLDFGNVDLPPVSCDWPTAEGASVLWCLFPNQLGQYREDGTWLFLDGETLGLSDENNALKMHDIIAEEDTKVWIASNQGLVFYGGSRLVTMNTISGGPPQ